MNFGEVLIVIIVIAVVAYFSSYATRRKQMPKKVMYEYDGYYDGTPVYDMARCPNCDKGFYEDENGWETTYCPDCGQRLDWSEEQ